MASVDVFSAELHAHAFFGITLECERVTCDERTRDRTDRRTLLERYAGALGGKGHRPVKGAGVDENEREGFGQVRVPPCFFPHQRGPSMATIGRGRDESLTSRS